jgi:hypothetical protein
MQMKKISILALLVLSCEKESAEMAFSSLKTSACDGDVSGFFSRVDWNSMQENIASSRNAFSAVTGKLATAYTKSQFEDDIRLGKASKWCQADRVDSDPDLSIVFFRINNSETLMAKFVNSGGKFVLTKISKD